MLSKTPVEPGSKAVQVNIAWIHGFRNLLGSSLISEEPVFVSNAVQDPFLRKVILDKSDCKYSISSGSGQEKPR